MALSVDDTTVPSVTLIEVTAADDPAVVQQHLLGLMDAGRKTALGGPRDVVARMRPDFARAWPDTDTILLDPTVGLGIHGFDANDTETRLVILAGWRWNDGATVDTQEAAPSRSARELAEATQRRDVDFQVASASPAMICKHMSQRLGKVAFGRTNPLSAQRRELRREMRRYCQYGSLSLHVDEPAQFTIASSWMLNPISLTVATEWALIRNEDIAEPSQASYLFWVKTVGEGDGMGFVHEPGREAHLGVDGSVHDLMDVAIHSGWGHPGADGPALALRRRSQIADGANLDMFRCGESAATRPVDCPAMAVLKKLYPEDSADGVVKVSTGEALAIQGHVLATGGRGGEPTTGLTLNLGISRAAGTTSNVSLPMVRTVSRGDRAYAWTTRWMPDMRALHRWSEKEGYVGNLADKTPLASSLNPRYEVMWELPLAQNAGRTLPYTVAYEAGAIHCRTLFVCAEAERSSGTVPLGGTRVGWMDRIVLRLPKR